ncbi:MAG3090 family protein [Mycoplasmopsis primatum]|uniref:MAG3090 family protein n=1 Tax=Mycoplasmopsis primatum TaxID=55604 RepID=UPI000497DCF4|nr:hypothetical protein [Mycoplasmopsis primatum]
MKRVGIYYSKSAKYPWVLKHPKKEVIIGEFKSQEDAFYWYISFKIETLILLFDESNQNTGQIAYIKDESNNNRFIFIPQSSGIDIDLDYAAICAKFGIDPLKFSKLKSDIEIENMNKDLIFNYFQDPRTYFEPRYEIKKRSKDDYLNNEARTKILQIELSGLADVDRHTRTQIATAIDEMPPIYETSKTVEENNTNEKINNNDNNKDDAKAEIKTIVTNENQFINQTNVNEIPDQKLNENSFPDLENFESQDVQTKDKEFYEKLDSDNFLNTAETDKVDNKTVKAIKEVNKKRINKKAKKTFIALFSIIVIAAIAFGVLCLLNWLGIIDWLPFIPVKQ